MVESLQKLQFWKFKTIKSLRQGITTLTQSSTTGKKSNDERRDRQNGISGRERERERFGNEI